MHDDVVEWGKCKHMKQSNRTSIEDFDAKKEIFKSSGIMIKNREQHQCNVELRKYQDEEILENQELIDFHYSYSTPQNNNKIIK